jgi:nickel-dependent lactate racemase
MQIKIAYGKGHIDLDLPADWDVQVVEPVFEPPIEDVNAALRGALANPIGTAGLSSQIRSGEKVGIIVNDITRATPTPAILGAVLSHLEHIPDRDIRIFNALGTHRPNSEQELRGMLGDEIVERFRIVQNDCFDRATQTYSGVTARGNPIWLNSELLACDLKVLTGFIEPHFFAGFSGGGKAVMPGMAGLETILGNHCAANIAAEKATWGMTEGNPIWEEAREVGKMTGRVFLVNVTLNRDKAITGVYAGDLSQAHAAGCRSAKRAAMVPVDQAFDLVITSNSGYPLDLNLYQAVKGMSAAAQVVKPGGAIVIAAECWDGIPEHGLFGQLLREAASAKALLDMICAPGYRRQDQWQAQILAQILLKADVFVHTHRLTPQQLRTAMVQPAEDLTRTLSSLVNRYGPLAKICVLPEGPVTIPFVKAPVI